MDKIIVWGDSVAKGVIYDENRGRYCLSKNSAVKIISETLGVEIVNRSKMGLTANDAVTIMEKDIANGLVGDAAIIEFGGNDCDFDWRAISSAPDSIHIPKTTVELFEEKMKLMINKVREAGMEPYLVTLPPIDSERYFDFVFKFSF